MSEVVTRYNYYFNSHQAEQYDINTPFCQFILSQPIKLSHPMNVFEISVPRAMIPYTFYQFSAARNSVTLTFTITGVNHQITIPDGNYTITQLAQLVVSTLQAYLVSIGFASALVSAAYNNTSNRLSFDLFNPTSLVLSFSYSRLGEALGFLTPFTLQSGVILISAIDCNVAPINMLFITSTIAGTGENFEQLQTSNTPTDIISSIPIIHSSKYYIPFEPANPLKTRLTRDTLSILEFSIVDNNGDAMVNFPLAWTFVVSIEELNVRSLFEHPTKEQQEIHNQPLADTAGPQADEIERIQQKSLDRLTALEAELKLNRILPRTKPTSQIKKRKITNV
jgi:hypothetical protein